MIALLGSTFVASLVGSLHCLGMCGPIASVATARTDRVRLPIRQPLSRAGWGDAVWATAAYNGSRLLSYLLLGAFAGGAGLVLDLSGVWAGVSQLATWVAAGTLIGLGGLGLLVAAGLRLPGLNRWSPSAVISRMASRLPRGRTRVRAALLGVLTGCMPCGWLWAFVITAASTGSPWSGALVMLVFWAGTLPSLTLVGLGSHRISTRLRSAVPWLMPLLVMLVGVLTLTRAPVAAVAESANTASPDGVAEPEAQPCH